MPSASRAVKRVLLSSCAISSRSRESSRKEKQSRADPARSRKVRGRRTSRRQRSTRPARIQERCRGPQQEARSRKAGSSALPPAGWRRSRSATSSEGARQPASHHQAETGRCRAGSVAADELQRRRGEEGAVISCTSSDRLSRERKERGRTLAGVPARTQASCAGRDSRAPALSSCRRA